MRYWKLAGSGLILATSFWTGLRAARRLREQRRWLRELQAALAQAAGEIAFAPETFAALCRGAARGRSPTVSRFFSLLAEEAERPGLRREGLTRRACAGAGLRLPPEAEAALEGLFDRFGSCDRESQLAQLRLAAEALDRTAGTLEAGLEGRCRSCELLGLSAGAALLVLVM